MRGLSLQRYMSLLGSCRHHIQAVATKTLSEAKRATLQSFLNYRLPGRLKSLDSLMKYIETILELSQEEKIRFWTKMKPATIDWYYYKKGNLVSNLALFLPPSTGDETLGNTILDSRSLQRCRQPDIKWNANYAMLLDPRQGYLRRGLQVLHCWHMRQSTASYGDIIQMTPPSFTPGVEIGFIVTSFDSESDRFLFRGRTVFTADSLEIVNHLSLEEIHYLKLLVGRWNIHLHRRNVDTARICTLVKAYKDLCPTTDWSDPNLSFPLVYMNKYIEGVIRAVLKMPFLYPQLARNKEELDKVYKELRTFLEEVERFVGSTDRKPEKLQALNNIASELIEKFEGFIRERKITAFFWKGYWRKAINGALILCREAYAEERDPVYVRLE